MNKFTKDFDSIRKGVNLGLFKYPESFFTSSC